MKRLFEIHGWIEIRQKGSHLIMGKGSQRESIPMHKELKKGMERALLKRLKDKK